jgi:plasmid stabilization system protein ParE
MSRRAIVRITANFERNLDEIRRYAEERELPSAFDDLLTLVSDEVIPRLESFPRLGFDFLARLPASREGLEHLNALKRRFGPEASLREYVAGDYLVLYAHMDERVHLVAIKHHRQLSFDLKGL